MNLFLILYVIFNGISNVLESNKVPINSENRVFYFYNDLMSMSIPMSKTYNRVFRTLKEHYGQHIFVPTDHRSYKFRATEMLSTTIAWNDAVSMFQRFLKTPFAVPYFQGNHYFQSDFDYTQVMHQNLKKFIDDAIEKKSHGLLQHLVENMVDVVPQEYFLPLSYQILEYLETHSSWYQSYRKEKDYTTSFNQFLNQGSLTTNDILRGAFHPESKLPLRLHQLAELSKTNETVLEQVATEPWILEYLRN
jgi:hypothetical protein